MFVAVYNSGASLGYVTPGPTTGQVIGGAAAAGITSGLTIGMTTGSIKRGGIAAAGSALIALAPFAGPIAGAFMVVAGGIVTAAATMFKGCGASCTETSRVANEASDAFNQIKSAYWNQATRTKSSQVAALAALESIAEQLQSFCSNPSFGDAGKRCISERLVRGGSAPWCPTGTGCDFWSTIYDPIANDAGVVDDSASAQITDALDSLVGGGDFGGLDNGLLLMAGALLVAGVLL